MRAENEREAAKKRSPAKAIRNDPSAKAVDATAMSEFIEFKN